MGERWGLRSIGVSLSIVLVAPFLLGAAVFPAPRSLVNDFAGVLDAPTAARITAIAEGLRRDTGVEFAVVTIPSYAPEASLDDYAAGLFKAWGIGKAQEDNGLLLIMALAERRVRIEIGYGLEPVVTDGRAGAIIDAEILPAFRRSEYGEGLARGAAALAQLVTTGSSEAPSERPSSRDELWLPVLFLGGFLLLALLTQSWRRRSRWGVWDGGVWGGSGGFGGFGGSGGGFGGFGGGASGGGGAGRGW
ncbi:MAG: TPM domain-containing protein [Nitrospirae bacterium]|nr:TPM domain-containing protein [Nitrospirota bacterium]